MDTASEAISFHGQLQDQAGKFYEALAHKFNQEKELFLTMAKEHRRHKQDVQRAYTYIISDALEAGFAFEGMNADAYQLDIQLDEDANYAVALKVALAIENTIFTFCRDGANRSQGLLHDVPEALDLVARRCKRRIQTLQSLLDKHSSN